MTTTLARSITGGRACPEHQIKEFDLQPMTILTMICCGAGQRTASVQDFSQKDRHPTVHWTSEQRCCGWELLFFLKKKVCASRKTISQHLFHKGPKLFTLSTQITLPHNNHRAGHNALSFGSCPWTGRMEPWNLPSAEWPNGWSTKLQAGQPFLGPST